MIENIKPLEDGEEEFVSIDEAIEQVDKYKLKRAPKLPSNPDSNDLTSESYDPDRLLPHAPRIYEIAKDIDTEFITVLQEDFKDLFLTATTIIYDRHNLESNITHPGTSLILPLKDKQIEIPSFEGENLEIVVSNKLGLPYLQALFDTEDSGEQIMKTLERLSDKDRGNIKIFTPYQQMRKNNPERMVGLVYSRNWFLISAQYKIQPASNLRDTLQKYGIKKSGK